ncbi:MAG: hypothetical protein OXQ94_13745 [Gemmatimonadota bacterium]|nr:hypothetical protein [Gemmatimonadota bacterium]
MLDRRIVHLMSGSLLAEYSQVLRRPGIAQLHRLTHDDICATAANWFHHTPKSIPVIKLLSEALNEAFRAIDELCVRWVECRAEIRKRVEHLAGRCAFDPRCTNAEDPLG